MTEPVGRYQIILHAYRHLFKLSRRATRGSRRAQYVARDLLRESFRKGQPKDWDEAKIWNTLIFLREAAKETGLEHRIFKNLLSVRYSEAVDYHDYKKPLGRANELIDTLNENKYNSYNMTIKMLNETMGLCLPSTKFYGSTQKLGHR
ncbi:MAG: hypothetical protein M1814_000762 [Vezdaea aestivalis]|nr:MAG: hypothetical protein M1814_000762 [Vezdaea aestivalis]